MADEFSFEDAQGPPPEQPDNSFSFEEASQPPPEAPSQAGSATRGLLRGAAAAPGMVAGAEIGSAIGGAVGGAIGAPGGPLALASGAAGSFLGGLGGAWVGGQIAGGVRNRVADTLQLDSPESRERDIQTNPYTSQIAEGVGSLSALKTTGTLAARAVGGLLTGGIDVLNQGVQKGVSNIDPTEALIAGGVGAAAPTPRFGRGNGATLGRPTPATDLTQMPAEPGHTRPGGETPADTGGVEGAPAPPPATTGGIVRLGEGEVPPEQAEALKGQPAASPTSNEGPTKKFARQETPLDQLPFAEDAEPLQGSHDEITPPVERYLPPEEVARRRAALEATGEGPPMMSERGNPYAVQAKNIRPVEGTEGAETASLPSEAAPGASPPAPPPRFPESSRTTYGGPAAQAEAERIAARNAQARTPEGEVGPIPDFLRRETPPENFGGRGVDGQNENVRTASPAKRYPGSQNSEFGTTRSGTPLRALKSQNWEVGQKVNAGFQKNMEVVAKNEDGSFTLKSPKGDIYTFSPHEGLTKGAPDIADQLVGETAKEFKPRSLSGGATEEDVSTAPKNYPGVGARPLTLPENQTPAEQAANAFQERARVHAKQREADIKTLTDKLQAAAKLPMFGKVQRNMKQMYDKLTAGQKLSDQHQKLYDEAGFGDMRDRLREFHEGEIADGRMRDVGQLEDNYVPLITEKQWQRDVAHEKYNNADPVAGNMKFMRKNDNSFDENYFQIRDKDGNTKIISSNPYDENFHVWDNGEARLIQNTRELNKGNTVKIDGKEWTLEPAKPDAIEAAGVKDADKDPVKFVRSPVVIAKKYLDMLEVQRNREILDHIRTDPAYKDVQKTPMGNKREMDWVRDNGWIESDLPELKGTYFAPDMAHALNDFHQPGFNVDLGRLGRGMAAVNRILTSAIFWNPIPHLFNTGYHWAVGRGADWANIPRLFRTGAAAINEVTTQGPLYRQLLREGTPFMWPAVEAGRLSKTLGRIGEVAIEQNPTFWNQAAKMMGLQHGSELVKLWYDGARRVLWQGGDVFTMQSVMENMAKGMTAPEAIAHTRVHLPDYTIPYKVMGERWMSQLLQDPRNILSVFNRYHYGMFKSLAKITHDTAMPGVPWDMRKQAIGNALALATLAFVVKPALDKMWQMMTGNKDAEARPRGPLAPLYAAKEVLTGKRDIASGIGTALTLSPFMRMGIDALTNQDWKHKTIITPGGSFKQQVAQGVGHAANYIAPINTFSEAFNPKSSKGGFLHELGAQLGDFKNPTQKQVSGQKKAEGFKKQEAERRIKKPDNAIEAGLNNLFGVKKKGYAAGGVVAGAEKFRSMLPKYRLMDA